MHRHCHGCWCCLRCGRDDGDGPCEGSGDSRRLGGRTVVDEVVVLVAAHATTAFGRKTGRR